MNKQVRERCKGVRRSFGGLGWLGFSPVCTATTNNSKPQVRWQAIRAQTFSQRFLHGMRFGDSPRGHPESVARSVQETCRIRKSYAVLSGAS
jgi:hypothetical protein